MTAVQSTPHHDHLHCQEGGNWQYAAGWAVRRSPRLAADAEFGAICSAGPAVDSQATGLVATLAALVW